MIVYKVVRESTRKSILARGFLELKYTKGKIVKSEKGTVGIFCFKTKDDAGTFIGKVLKVRPIGRKMPLKKIIKGVIRAKNIKEYKKLLKYTKPINSLFVCYPAVEVLE